MRGLLSTTAKSTNRPPCRVGPISRKTTDLNRSGACCAVSDGANAPASPATAMRHAGSQDRCTRTDSDIGALLSARFYDIAARRRAAWAIAAPAARVDIAPAARGTSRAHARTRGTREGRMTKSQVAEAVSGAQYLSKAIVSRSAIASA